MNLIPTDFHTSTLLLDGATGTNLMRAGLPEGVCVERWILEHPAALQSLQQEFVQAGSQIVLAPTFGANRTRLRQFGLQQQVAEFNRQLVQLSREAVGTQALVAGDVSPSGVFCEPFGDWSFEALVELYTEQIAAQKQAGVDLVIAETMMGLADTRAAVLAARRCGVPVVASITVNASGRTLSGMSPATAAVALQAAGAAAVGLNCSTGPVEMAAFVRQMQPFCRVPLLAKPNAGAPGQALPPAQFAAACAALTQNGVRMVGGCCQTTPEHIAALKSELEALQLPQDPILSAFEDRLIQKAADGEAPRLPLTFPLCTETRIFETPETLRLSAPLACNEDTPDALADADDANTDAVLLEIADEDALHAFFGACFASSLPVAVHAAQDTLLQKALLGYQGRAAALCDNSKQVQIALQLGARVLQA